MATTRSLFCIVVVSSTVRVIEHIEVSLVVTIMIQHILIVAKEEIARVMELGSGSQR